MPITSLTWGIRAQVEDNSHVNEARKWAKLKGEQRGKNKPVAERMESIAELTRELQQNVAE